MTMHAVEAARLRQLERVILNQLGTTDPREVAEWITAARGSLRTLQSRSTFVDPLLVEKLRCAPQADGADEQDVIAIQRAYTASRDGC